MSKFWEVYEAERSALGPLPDADADYIALANAIDKTSMSEYYAAVSKPKAEDKNNDF